MTPPTTTTALAGVRALLPVPLPGTVVFGLEVPSAAWMSANRRIHWGERKRRTAWLRQLAWARAGEQRLTRGLVTPVQAVAYVSTPSRRREDPNNANPTTKALIDGLTDHGCWPDDDSEHVLGPDHRRGPLTPDERWVVFYFSEGVGS